MLSQLVYYTFFTTPSPAFGVVDFYVLNPIDSLVRKTYKVAELTLRERLGGGNYGQVSGRSVTRSGLPRATAHHCKLTLSLPQVFEGIINKNGSRVPVTRELTREEKRRRVVLKRVNRDSLGMRSDFLRAGTMAQVLLCRLSYWQQPSSRILHSATHRPLEACVISIWPHQIVKPEHVEASQKAQGCLHGGELIFLGCRVRRRQG